MKHYVGNPRFSKVFLLVVTFGLFHGLVFLPVLLCLVKTSSLPFLIFFICWEGIPYLSKITLWASNNFTKQLYCPELLFSQMQLAFPQFFFSHIRYNCVVLLPTDQIIDFSPQCCPEIALPPLTHSAAALQLLPQELVSYIYHC